MYFKKDTNHLIRSIYNLLFLAHDFNLKKNIPLNPVCGQFTDQ